jgi:hypothetical protein
MFPPTADTQNQPEWTLGGGQLAKTANNFLAKEDLSGGINFTARQDNNLVAVKASLTTLRQCHLNARIHGRHKALEEKRLIGFLDFLGLVFLVHIHPP